MENRLTTIMMEIENVRGQLHESLGGPNDVDSCYELSVKLDKLIEEYIELGEEVDTVLNL